MIAELLLELREPLGRLLEAYGDAGAPKFIFGGVPELICGLRELIYEPSGRPGAHFRAVEAPFWRQKRSQIGAPNRRQTYASTRPHFSMILDLYLVHVGVEISFL